MKYVKIKADEFNTLIKKYKECIKANEMLNKQIKEYNEKFTKEKEK